MNIGIFSLTFSLQMSEKYIVEKNIKVLWIS